MNGYDKQAHVIQYIQSQNLIVEKKFIYRKTVSDTLLKNRNNNNKCWSTARGARIKNYELAQVDSVKE